MHGVGGHWNCLRRQRGHSALRHRWPGGQTHAVGASSDFTFVQISDSHIGLNREPNKDVTATFQEAVTKINAMRQPPDFIIHTGDLSHLSKPTEFDTVDQVLKGAKTSEIFYVPGE